MDDLVRKARNEGRIGEDGIIDAETKLRLEKKGYRGKLSRFDVFSEMRDVDRYFTQGFTTFLLVYKPVSLNDLTDKLEAFSKVQDKQSDPTTYINMSPLSQKLLDEYTIFLSKFGKYIVGEIRHQLSIEKHIRSLQ